MKVTFLGTGTSRGIPVIGCDCRVCRSSNPKNKRLRSSLLIESEATVVIDTSVDFRLQMLRHDVRRLDAVVFTHAHADHVLGLDDVFPLSARAGRAIPAYASRETVDQLRVTFRYLFAENRYPGIAEVELRVIDGLFQIGDLCFQPIEVFHGNMPVLGFRIGDLAYVTDVNRIPESSLEKLQGLRYLILDGLRYRPHVSHFSLREAAEVASRLSPQMTYLIHMSHDVDHDEGNAQLPESVRLSYDGLILTV
ncbi:MAG TPA: MBL fold metallo-hydrolase [Acidobacteriota bacterium]|nr:MBL fold metallo-hydrolase [Acidobacteriota bacterium]